MAVKIPLFGRGSNICLQSSAGFVRFAAWEAAAPHNEKRLTAGEQSGVVF